MTPETLATYMQNPQDIDARQTEELDEVCKKYPYFSIARALYLKGLHNTGNESFEPEKVVTALHVPDRSLLYYLIFPSTDMADKAGDDSALYSAAGGSYFDIQDEEESRQSLKSLAQKLREARLKKAAEKEAAAAQSDSTPSGNTEKFVTEEPDPEKYTEEYAVALIRERRYEEALKILRVLHLNIPKKSVYFADQIRFLEKIIATINKS
jgi:hypothetical protein